MTPLLLTAGAMPVALLPAHTVTASAPTLTLVEAPARLPRYKFPVGKQVYVRETSYQLGVHSYQQIVTETLRRIVNRTRLRNLRTGLMENWYTMEGFPSMHREESLSLKARYHSYDRRMVAAA